MIFGMTHEDRRRTEEAGTVHFAWRPREMTDGRWVWLAPYRRRRRKPIEVPYGIKRWRDYYTWEPLA